MVDFFKLLSENSIAVGIILSFFVTFATLVYAILTWKLVAETRKMRKAQTDAKIGVRVETRKEAINILDFIVKNEGGGPAYNIKFSIISNGSKGTDNLILSKINNFGFIIKGIDYMSSKQEIRTFLTNMLEKFDNKINTVFKISVSYNNGFGENIVDTYLIDISLFKGTHQLEKPYLYQISEELKKIGNDFHHIVIGFKKIMIITQSKADFDLEEEARIEDVKKILNEETIVKPLENKSR